MRPLFKNIWADRSGNFGIMTAAILVPLFGTVGMALDFSYALDRRVAYLAAADAAAIGALTSNSAGVIAAINASKNGKVTIAEDDAQKLFLGQASEGLDTNLADLTIDVTKEASLLKSEVTFKVNIPTTFLKILNKDSIEISGTATAVYDTGTFIDFYMLLDNTPSMGVGATLADIDTLERHTSDSCAFACHDLSNANNYYKLAKSLNVSMRIDVVRQAVQQLTYTAADSAVYAGQYRMAVYTFGASAEKAKLTAVANLNTNMSSVRSSANAIDLMTIPYQNYNNDQTTDLDGAFKDLKSIIKEGGTGISKSDPQKVVFFVSDGLTDSAKGTACTKKTTNGTRCQEPIDYSNCEPLKKAGIKIAALYTTYLPLPKNSWYNTWIKPFQSEIATKMKACASPGLYFEVSPTEGISDAMQTLFQKVISQPRLAS